MTKKTPLYIIDAFSDQPFGGNPAAVCLLEANQDERWMQRVAAEMNLSETAFLYTHSDNLWSLRWFTPTIEVDLCGHATLAAAHVLRTECGVTASEVTFRTRRSGDLSVFWEGEAICLDFPKVSAEAVEPIPEFCDAIGSEVVTALRSRDDLILVLPDAETVKRVVPDHGKIKYLASRGVVVTAIAEDANWDFVSRFFAPQSGIPEDPVTGSAHCYLGPYWGKILNKTHLFGYQASARGGVVGVKLAGERVILQGRATTMVKGELHA